MLKYFISLAIVTFLFQCRRSSDEGTVPEEEFEFNQELADELNAIAVTDQIAAFIPQGTYKEWSPERWKAFQDSVFNAHKIRMREIFEEFGYPGHDLVGKDGARHFWLMVQHSDSDPEFQSRVLEKLKVEVDRNNAEASYFGLLTDRVMINTGRPQVYGTQVEYNAYGQARPKSLEDSVNVNKRRAEIGLEPLEEYLNRMTQSHFEMNKVLLMRKGITEPRLYSTGE